MADETLYAVLDADGVVENVIVADADFIAELQSNIADPDVDTGAFTSDQRFVDVTDKGVGVGWKRAGNGRFTAPVPPEPTPEELQAQEDAEAAATRRTADDAFLAGLQDKVAAGESLTQDERDRMALIQLSRD